MICRTRAGLRSICGLLLMFSACELGGCAAAAVVGPDVAETMIEKGIGLFSVGKNQAYQPVKIEDAVVSTRKAASDLDLKLLKETPHPPEKFKFVYVDDRKKKITITLVRRTATVTEFHTNVGLFGPWGMGRLTLRRILHELPGGTPEDKRAVE